MAILSLRKVLAIGLGLALAAPLAIAQENVSTGTATQHPHSINSKQKRQQKRIQQGVKSGALTKKEAVKLETKEHRIQRRETKMRESGGKFTKGERAAVQHQMNNTSKQIYKQKHDQQDRH